MMDTLARNGFFMFFARNGLQIVGHRGCPSKFPDNTMAGFAEAFATVTMVETDVRRSLDGLLVLSHDAELGGHVVSETEWEVLRGVDLGAGQRPLLLSEALAAYPDAAFNLEVKNWPSDPGFEPDGRLGVEVAEVSRPGDLLSSFHWATMDVVRTQSPSVATGLLLEPGVGLDAAIGHAVSQGHTAVIPHWSMLMDTGGPAVVESAHRHGVAVATWTVNEIETARRLAGIGVDAVITDHPRELSAALEEDQ